ncbi:MAG: hypothetical protein ABIC57_02930 [bacterium]
MEDIKSVYYGGITKREIERAKEKGGIGDLVKYVRSRALELYKDNFKGQPEIWIEWEINDERRGWLLDSKLEKVQYKKAILMKYISEKLLTPSNMVIKDLDFIKGE